MVCYAALEIGQTYALASGRAVRCGSQILRWPGDGNPQLFCDVEWPVSWLWLPNCCFASVYQCDIALNLDTVPIRQGHPQRQGLHLVPPGRTNELYIRSRARQKE